MATVPISELQEVADLAAKGIRVPEAMRKASDRLDALRKTVEKRVGTVKVAVDLVREARE